LAQGPEHRQDHLRRADDAQIRLPRRRVLRHVLPHHEGPGGRRLRPPTSVCIPIRT
jgi:hypothetical protein